MMRPPTQPRLTPTPPPALARRPGGFTLVELMIAMAIIVLLIGVALPVFRVINGSRSQEGASNQIAAMLAQARNDAIGLQVPTGVAFFTDSAGHALMAEVQQVQFANYSPYGGYSAGSYVSYVSGSGATSYYVNGSRVEASTPPSPLPSPLPGPGSGWSLISTTGGGSLADSPGFYYLFDQIPDTDAQRLPAGIGTMVLSDPGATVGGAANVQDRYMHIGLMLFDANGRLTSSPYWMSQFGLVGVSAGYKAKAYDICQRQGTRILTASNLSGLNPPVAVSTPCTLSSSIGLVTFDGEAYAAQGGPNGDYIVDSAVSSYGTASTAGTKAAADAYLDTNGTPVLINRYNGTLLRSE